MAYIWVVPCTITKQQVLPVVDLVALPLRREHVAVRRTAPAGVEASVVRPIARSEEGGVGEVHPLYSAFGLGSVATDNAGVDVLRARRLDVAHELVRRVFGGRRGEKRCADACKCTCEREQCFGFHCCSFLLVVLTV